MKIDYTNIKDLRAKFLTQPVTLAYCDAPDMGYSKEFEDFNPPGNGMGAAHVQCYRWDRHEPTVTAFHRVDYMMGFHAASNFPLILVYPLQEIVQDPYDAEEMEALSAIAKGWAEQTGAKIVLILDKANTASYYPKRFY